MAVLGLRFCARSFSSCGKWGPPFIAVRGPLTIAASRCGAQPPDVQAQQLWLMDVVAPRHVGSSQTRARTRVPCIGRQILNHCTTTEALHILLIVVMFLIVTRHLPFGMWAVRWKGTDTAFISFPSFYFL